METTVEQMNQVAMEIISKKNEIDASEAVTKNLNGQLRDLEAKALSLLTGLGQKSFQSPLATLTQVEKWRVNLPKTEEDKASFFAYLKERGEFDGMISVNANTLNSYFLGEWKAAQERGEGMDFKIPGIGEPTLHVALGTRKR